MLREFGYSSTEIDALITTDPLGIITDVNKQMEALTGCTRDELIGAPFKDYFTDPERAEAGIKRVLGESKLTDYELTARARDGRETVVSYNASTFHDRGRNLQGVFAAARDVTERKRFERTLQENNVELEKTKAAAEKANLAKSDFLNAPVDVAIDPTDPTRIYVVAQNVPCLYVSTDGGATFSSESRICRARPR